MVGDRPVAKNQSIWLPGFVREHGDGPNLLRRWWFIECHIEGPAIVLPRDGTNFLRFGLSEDPDDFLWPVTVGRKAVGTIVLSDCLFDSCQFSDIGITGGPGLMAQAREAWTGLGDSPRGT